MKRRSLKIRRTAEEWIHYLDLNRHPEGGWFKETYRSDEHIKKHQLPARFSGDRVFATSIYFLLKSTEFSAFHKIKQDEIWYFHEGTALKIYVIDENEEYLELILGNNPNNNEQPQVIVKAGWLFAARVIEENSFSLVGCSVAPGFEFADFEMPARQVLLDLYPQFKSIIMQFTKG